MATKLKGLLVDRVDLVDKGANPDAHIMLYKRDSGDIINKKEEKAMTFEELMKSLNDDQQAIIKAELDAKDAAALKEKEDALKKAEEDKASVQKALDELKEEVQKAAKPAEDILKSVPEEVRKMVEDAKAEAQAAVKKSQDLEDRMAKRDFIAKAATLEGLPTDADTFGPVLKNISSAVPEDYKILIDVLEKAANTIKESDLFKTIGSDVDGGATSDVTKRVETLAQELKKSDSSLTIEQARLKVLEADPNLYKQYREGGV